MTPDQLDRAVWPLFYKMHKRGIRVNTDGMLSLRRDVLAMREEQEAAIEIYAGRAINPASGDEVAAWLDENFSIGKKTKSRTRRATDERSLSEYPQHPVIDAVLEWRGLNKIETAFIAPILEKCLLADSTVIHPKWRLTKVKSGRVAMEDPNLLAFPARDEMGRKVRSCFIPQPGNKFVSVDFSQLEPRIVAALSRDPKLLKIYEGTDGDIYTGCAKDLGISRTAAKILTLGMLYGMTAKRLQSQLQIVGTHTELDACEALIDTWFATYEGVETLVHRVVHHAQECGGWAYTEGGRGRFLPGLFIDGPGYPAEMMREEAERQAFNHLVQGTGMEQLKHAMLRADEACPEYPMVLAIHDEVIFEVPSDDDEAEERLATTMYTEFHGVPLITKSTVGDDWGSLKS